MPEWLCYALTPLPLPVGHAGEEGPGVKGCTKRENREERAITELESMPEGWEGGWKKSTGRNLRGQLQG